MCDCSPPKIQFVNVDSNLIQGAIQVATDAFGAYGLGADMWEVRFSSDPQAQYSQLRVGIQSSKVVATARLYWRNLLVDNATIPAAVIGDIAVSPDRQGSGIGHALMQDTIAYMRKRGVMFVLLGGRPSFYRQFGFSLFWETRMVINSQSCLELLADNRWTVNVGADHLLGDDRWYHLWNLHYQDCYSRFQRDLPFAKWLLHDRRFHSHPAKLVCTIRHNEQLLGYALAGSSPDRITVLEMAWQPAHIDVAGALLTALARQWPDCSSISLIGPEQPQLSRWLTLKTVQFSREDLESLGMACILDLPRVVQTLYPLWRAKIKTPARSKPLVFIGQDNTTVLVDWKSEKVKTIPLCEIPKQAIVLNLDQDRLLKLILGFCSACQLNLPYRLRLSPEDSSFLLGLFPEHSGFFGGLEKA